MTWGIAQVVELLSSKLGALSSMLINTEKKSLYHFMGQAWWHTHVIPVIHELEIRGS
jgi:hypothetical protein